MLLTIQKLFIGLLVFFILIGTAAAYISAQIRFNALSSIGNELSYEEIQEQIFSSALQEGLVVFLTFVAFASVFFFVVNVFVLRPLLELRAFAREQAENQFNIRLKVRSRNEILDLVDVFHRMVSRLHDEQKHTETVAKMKSRFITVAGHKFRTPLSEIKWGLNELKIKGLSKEEETTVKDIEKTTAGMIELINDFLIAAEIEDGVSSYDFKYAQIESLIRTSVEEILPAAKVRNIKVTMDKFPSNIPAVKIDPSKISLVLKYLLDNAIKYNKEIGGTIEINLIVKKEVMEVIVTDNGIGIPKEEQQYIWGNFFRGDKALSIETEGTGLGLYIAKNIVERHGGSVRFESKEDEGSMFAFTIPHEKKIISEKEKNVANFLSDI